MCIKRQNPIRLLEYINAWFSSSVSALGQNRQAAHVQITLHIVQPARPSDTHRDDDEQSDGFGHACAVLYPRIHDWLIDLACCLG